MLRSVVAREIPGVEFAATEEHWEFSWSEGMFKPGEVAEDDSRRGMSIRGYKRELRWLKEVRALPFELVPMEDTGRFGSGLERNTKHAQAYWKLQPDGVIGPVTSREFHRKRIEVFQAKYQIPENLVGRQMTLEADFYLAGLNWTNDRSSGQLHDVLGEEEDAKPARFPSDGKLVCPNGDLQYAHRVGVNVRYCAEHMHMNFVKLSKAVPEASDEDTWRAAVFAYNAPAWSEPWLQAGLPATGGEILSKWMQDLFKVTTRNEWATLYTKVVYARQF